MDNGIFGLQPWAVFLGFIILIMAFYIYSQITARQRLNNKVDGKVWVDFYNQSNGECKSYLCEVMGEAEIKIPDNLLKTHKVDKDKLTGIQLPEQIGDGVYFTLKEAQYTAWYPPGKKIQVKVDKVAYVVGIPLPIVSINCNLWTDEMLSTMASSLIRKSRDELTLQALKAQDSSWWDNLDKFTVMMKKIPTIQWICIGAMGAAGIGAFFSYQVMEALKSWGS